MDASNEHVFLTALKKIYNGFEYFTAQMKEVQVQNQEGSECTWMCNDTPHNVLLPLVRCWQTTGSQPMAEASITAHVSDGAKILRKLRESYGESPDASWSTRPLCPVTEFQCDNYWTQIQEIGSERVYDTACRLMAFNPEYHNIIAKGDITHPTLQLMGRLREKTLQARAERQEARRQSCGKASPKEEENMPTAADISEALAHANLSGDKMSIVLHLLHVLYMPRRELGTVQLVDGLPEEEPRNYLDIATGKLKISDYKTASTYGVREEQVPEDVLDSCKNLYALGVSQHEPGAAVFIFQTINGRSYPPNGPKKDQASLLDSYSKWHVRHFGGQCKKNITVNLLRKYFASAQAASPSQILKTAGIQKHSATIHLQDYVISPEAPVEPPEVAVAPQRLAFSTRDELADWIHANVNISQAE